MCHDLVVAIHGSNHFSVQILRHADPAHNNTSRQGERAELDSPQREPRALCLPRILDRAAYIYGDQWFMRSHTNCLATRTVIPNLGKGVLHPPKAQLPALVV